MKLGGKVTEEAAIPKHLGLGQDSPLLNNLQICLIAHESKLRL